MIKTSTKSRTVRMEMKGQTQNRIRGRIYRFSDVEFKTKGGFLPWIIRIQKKATYI